MARDARHPPQARIEVGNFHGAVHAADWRLVARSDAPSVGPSGWRRLFRPSAKTVAEQVAGEVGPLVRGYIGFVLYRESAEEAEAAATSLRASLDSRLERPAEIRIERWNPTMKAWQPPDLFQNADEREVAVIGTVRCASAPAAAELAAALRRGGQLFVKNRNRRVILGSSGQAEARALLSDFGDVRVTPIRRFGRNQLVASLLYDRWTDVKKGGWLAYDPSGY